jgi:ABC-type lipoprotein export system ATPase subunit
VLDALRMVSQNQGKTVVMVTHSREAAQVGSIVREMRDGQFI